MKNSAIRNKYFLSFPFFPFLFHPGSSFHLKTHTMVKTSPVFRLRLPAVVLINITEIEYNYCNIVFWENPMVQVQCCQS